MKKMLRERGRTFSVDVGKDYVTLGNVTVTS